MVAQTTPMDDPNVKMPAAIKASAARASQIHDAAYKKEPPKDPAAEAKDPAKDPATDPAKLAAEPPKDPAAEAKDPAKDAPASDVTSKGNDKQEPQGGWEHAFKSMKGRFERSQEANRALQDRVAGLEATIASMQAASKEPARHDPAAAAESLLTQKEVEDYGADFLGVVGKKAKEIVTPEVKALRDKVAELESRLGTVGQTVIKNARDEMKAQLKREVPNWEQVNVSQDFLEWLALPDAFSGAIRHNLLKDAWGRNDAARVLAFFKGFLATEASGTPQNRQEPAQNQETGKVPLEAFAAPGRAKTAAASTDAPAEKPIFTRAQITQFYTDSAAGKYRGREEEKNKIEQQIFAAEREGRIR